MPDTPAQIADKVAALTEMHRAGQPLAFAELVLINWQGGDAPRHYCFQQLDQVRDFKNVLALAPLIETRLITSKGQRFIKLPRTAALADDKIELTFSDLDNEFSRLCYEQGQGVRAEVYSYYPQVDLLLPDFTGTLGAPKERSLGEPTVKLTVTVGFRSPNLLLPHRLPLASCPFIFGAFLDSQEAIDLHQGCPYNAHLTEAQRGGAPLIGVPGETDCARDSVATCSSKLLTTRYFPGYQTTVESIANNQTSGPNLRATSVGNESNLSDPIRAIYGSWLAKGLRVLSYRVESNTRHPEQGFIAAQIEIGEGRLGQTSGHAIANVPVGYQHLNVRNGALGQQPTGFSPNVPTYSGTAVFFGRIQGDFRNANASSLSASCYVNQGLSDLHVYSDGETYAEAYSNSPVDCLLDILTRKRFGYGEDARRYDIASVIETRAWHAENTAFRDELGNLFGGTRATFNAELTARATQKQVYDICATARMAVPFMHNGKKVFRPLRKETIDDSIKVFRARGKRPNICTDNGSNKSPLLKWSYVGDDQLTNQVIVSFHDEARGYVETKLTFGDQRQQLKAGRAWGDTTIRIISQTYPAVGCTNFAQAARFGNTALYLGLLDKGGIKNNLKVNFTTWFAETLSLRPYDLVKLEVTELEQFGFDYFRVLEITRLPDLRVELEVQAYPVDYYEQIEAEAGELLPGVYEPNPGGGPLDRPFPVDYGDVTVGPGGVRFQLLDLSA